MLWWLLTKWLKMWQSDWKSDLKHTFKLIFYYLVISCHIYIITYHTILIKFLFLHIMHSFLISSLCKIASNKSCLPLLWPSHFNQISTQKAQTPSLTPHFTHKYILIQNCALWFLVNSNFISKIFSHYPLPYFWLEVPLICYSWLCWFILPSSKLFFRMLLFCQHFDGVILSSSESKVSSLPFSKGICQLCCLIDLGLHQW